MRLYKKEQYNSKKLRTPSASEDRKLGRQISADEIQNLKRDQRRRTELFTPSPNNFRIQPRSYVEQQLYFLPTMSPQLGTSHGSFHALNMSTSCRELPSTTSRTSLASSIIYELVEQDTFNFTLENELKCTQRTIQKLQSIYNHNLHLFLQAIATALDTTHKTISSKNRKLTTTPDVLQPLRDLNSPSPSTRQLSRSELEQHLVDGESSGSNFSSGGIEVFTETIGKLQNLVKVRSAEFMDELKGVEVNLSTLRNALEEKEEETKQMINEFQEERKMLKETCERLTKEKQILNDDIRMLRDSKQRLEMELRVYRENCRCINIGTPTPKPVHRRYYSSNTNYNTAPFGRTSINDSFRGSGSINQQTPPPQSTSSHLSDPNTNGTPLSPRRDTWGDSSSPIPPPITTSSVAGENGENVNLTSSENGSGLYEDPAFSNSPSNTEIDTTCTPYVSDSVLAPTQSSGSVGSPYYQVTNATMSVNGQPISHPNTPVYNRQRSLSAEQVIQPFPTNALQYDMFQRGYPTTPKSRHSTALPNSVSALMGMETYNSPRSRNSVADCYKLKSPNPLKRAGSRESSVLDLSVPDSSRVARESPIERIERFKLEVPIHTWPPDVCVDWLKYDLQLGKDIPSKFEQNVKDVQTLLTLKSSDMKNSLGIEDKFDRKRLLRAISFLNELHASKGAEKAEKVNLLSLDVTWMSNFFIDFVGLREYSQHFSRNRIDGVLMCVMNLEDIENVIKSDGRTSKAIRHCAVSIWHGWQLMKILHYNKKKLEERMLACRFWDIDPIVWSNDRFHEWLKKQNFEKEALNLVGLGIHGALLVLSKSFTTDKIIEKMKLKNTKESLPIRTVLYRKLNELLAGPRRLALELDNETTKNKDNKSRSVPALNHNI